MAREPLERLVLPRLDWHDSEGRINKDALIENFNAIETKINELAAISAFDITAPDFSTFSYNDVTLESPDNKIVNLKSFVDIMNLKGFPIVCTWDDKVLKKLQYYNDNYQLVTITNTDISSLGTNGQIWVYLDYSEDMVYTSADGSNPNNDILLACYDDGIVHSIGGLGLIDVNILNVCANMTRKLVNTNMQSGEGPNTYKNGNRSVGQSWRESGGQRGFGLIFRDFGV